MRLMEKFKKKFNNKLISYLLMLAISMLAGLIEISVLIISFRFSLKMEILPFPHMLMALMPAE